MKTSLHSQSSHKNAPLTQKTLHLEGMGCAACATTIETAINIEGKLIQIGTQKWMEKLGINNVNKKVHFLRTSKL